MSSKSAVKLVVTDEKPGALYKWAAIHTGSKNALKGVGFFVGALGLSVVGRVSSSYHAFILAAGVLSRLSPTQARGRSRSAAAAHRVTAAAASP